MMGRGLEKPHHLCQLLEWTAVNTRIHEVASDVKQGRHVKGTVQGGLQGRGLVHVMTCWALQGILVVPKVFTLLPFKLVSRHPHFLVQTSGIYNSEIMSSPLIVMGIPIPLSAQQLPQSPPVCPPSEGDIKADKLLCDLGNRHGVEENVIIQARSLASGPSDLVIILERPQSNANYNVPFDQFVASCPTLQAVDEVIRFATKGARGIHTVTVLDAFSYKPNKGNTRLLDKDCHETLAQILQAKKPRVVIRCHRDEYQQDWMKRFDIPGEEYELRRKNVDFGHGHVAILFQSFHPSIAASAKKKKSET